MDFKDIPAYVISCASDIERRQVTEKRFQEKGLPFTFFDASDGYHLPKEVFEKEDIQHEHPGARGVALSHKRLWKKMVEENIPYMAIYEDDVIFHPQFNHFSEIMWQECLRKAGVKGEKEEGEEVEEGGKKDFIAFMGYCCFHLEKMNTQRGRKTRDMKPQVSENFPMALHAYIISKPVAQWFLDNYGVVTENVDIHMQKLFYEKHAPFLSFVWWNGLFMVEEQTSAKFNVYFNGFCYQDHEIQLSIHRDR